MPDSDSVNQCSKFDAGFTLATSTKEWGKLNFLGYVIRALNHCVSDELILIKGSFVMFHEWEVGAPEDWDHVDECDLEKGRNQVEVEEGDHGPDLPASKQGRPQLGVHLCLCLVKGLALQKCQCVVEERSPEYRKRHLCKQHLLEYGTEALARSDLW